MEVTLEMFLGSDGTKMAGQMMLKELRRCAPEHFKDGSLTKNGYWDCMKKNIIEKDLSPERMNCMERRINMRLKVCLLGDGAVGKTCLIRRSVENTFIEDYIPTIGTRTSKKEVVIKDPKQQIDFHLDLIVWDILGQLSFKKLLHHSYLNGAKGAVLVCDLTRNETLEHLDDWIDSLSTEWHMVPTAFVGNKGDLTEQFEFGPKEIENVASQYDSPHFICSAKTGENVEEFFNAIGEKIVKNHAKPPDII